ncbi:MAG: biotin carboxylase N-terminal domain-containing protein [Nocardioides sp.]|uniref:acetyl/propionyl/methylcrotonyl-CoA carboxylase subunit alpha n=1 Tax=Nocardioides sp. TaxID=35761 RepID=UPI0039E6E02D
MNQGNAITCVLVANRGEIARRVFATCRRRDLGTVAVFSDADADSPHVAEADQSVWLPGNIPAETYLRADLILEAARRTGADAIHPGYGFLSENAEFARAVTDAGLRWIGPSAEAIEVMGSKVASKEMMAEVGVPVLGRLDPEAITADELPVLVKASAGGGGRGMRIVRTLDELPEAMEAAAREAASAFGDPTVFCERYLESGHHVEVQVLADARGTVWALGERECSLQRRHQKVIEEAPSPLVERLGEEMRTRLLDAGRRAAGAIGYLGAGTVEFLADDRGGFWFLEMNTRLQVEHPVTECVTGRDLVDLQIDVAEGLPLTGDEPTMSGHAIEARLYAEDALDGWLPQTGTIETFDIPDVQAEFALPPRPGIRLDSGFEAGSRIGTHYDAMLAKVIAFAPTRQEAARELASTLRRSRIHGLVTNRDLLVASLRHPEFLAGTADTSFYTEHPPEQLGASGGLEPRLAAVVAALSDAAVARSSSPLPTVASGFRNVPGDYQVRSYAHRGEEIRVDYRYGRDGLELGADTELGQVDEIQADADRVALRIDGVQKSWRIARFMVGDTPQVVVDGADGSVTLAGVPRYVDPSTELPAGALTAPMPGSIQRLGVELGDTVEAGQPLLWLEAMKMEHAVVAPCAGVVSELPVVVGQQVEQGATLAIVDALDETSSA